jgi:hypothetical protein
LQWEYAINTQIADALRFPSVGEANRHESGAVKLESLLKTGRLSADGSVVVGREEERVVLRHAAAILWLLGGSRDHLRVGGCVKVRAARRTHCDCHASP